MGAADETNYAARFGALEDAVERIETALTRLGEVLDRLTRVEERHADTRDSVKRAFERLEKLEERQIQVQERYIAMQAEQVAIRTDNQLIKAELSKKLDAAGLDDKLEPLRETRKWVIGGILAVVSLVGAAVIGLVVIKNSSQSQPAQVIELAPPAQPRQH